MGTIFQDFSPLNSLHFSLDETKIDIDLSLCSPEIKLPTFHPGDGSLFSPFVHFLYHIPIPVLITAEIKKYDFYFFISHVSTSVFMLRVDGNMRDKVCEKEKRR